MRCMHRGSLLLPFAAIRQRRARALLTAASSAFGFCLFGFISCMSHSLSQVAPDSRHRGQLDEATSLIASIALIALFIVTSSAISQSVRSRLRQLAILKAIGFSSIQLLRFVVLEAAIPGIGGAILGIGCSRSLAMVVVKHLQHGELLPPPQLSTAAIVVAAAAALLIPLLSAAIPAWRVIRLNVASDFAG